jgi:hypothetical protein
MTTHRLVYLKEQVGINMDTFREMLGSNNVTVKNIKNDSKGVLRRVTAMLLVEVNKAEQVTLGSSELAAKVLAIPLASPDSAYVSVGGDETARKKFFAPLAEEIFHLEMSALVSHPDAGRAFVDYWRKKKPLPDSSWRPPLLAEVQQATRAAGGRRWPACPTASKSSWKRTLRRPSCRTRTSPVTRQTTGHCKNWRKS